MGCAASTCSEPDAAYRASAGNGNDEDGCVSLDQGEECDEPSSITRSLRIAKAVLVARALYDINGDPDQFPSAADDPSSSTTTTTTIADAKRTVIVSGWLAAVQDAMNAEEDLESVTDHAGASPAASARSSSAFCCSEHAAFSFGTHRSYGRCPSSSATSTTCDVAGPFIPGYVSSPQSENESPLPASGRGGAHHHQQLQLLTLPMMKRRGSVASTAASESPGRRSVADGATPPLTLRAIFRLDLQNEREGCTVAV